MSLTRWQSRAFHHSSLHRKNNLNSYLHSITPWEASLNNFKKTGVIVSIFSDDKGRKVDINKRNKIEKCTSVKIKQQTPEYKIKYHKINENRNTT